MLVDLLLGRPFWGFADCGHCTAIKGDGVQDVREQQFWPEVPHDPGHFHPYFVSLCLKM